MGELSTDGGRIHELIVDEHTGPYQVQPLYRWVFGWVWGDSTWPWKPYGPEPGPASSKR